MKSFEKGLHNDGYNPLYTQYWSMVKPSTTIAMASYNGNF
jgi:hypothetical protein